MKEKEITKINTNLKDKRKLVEELWKIRREEKFSDWSDVKKRLNLV